MGKGTIQLVLFLHALLQGDNTIMAWTKQSRGKKKTACFNCNQEGHIVKDCPLNKGENERRNQICFLCNQAGHFKQDCPNKLKSLPPTGQQQQQRLCYLCNQSGHLRQDCPNKTPKPVQERTSNSSSRVCYKCNQPGHLAKDCPDKEERVDDGGGSSEKQLCYMCHQPGHIKLDCPTRKDGEVSQVQCFNCNQRGHFKRDCPELASDSKSSQRRDDRSRFSYDSSAVSAEEHWPVLSKEPEVKKKYTHPLSSSSNGGDVAYSPTNKVPSAGKNVVDASTNGTAKQEGQVVWAETEVAGNSSKYQGQYKRGPRTPFPPFIDTHCHLEYVFERYGHRGSFLDFMKERKYPENFDGCIASFCDPAAFSSFGTWSDLLEEADSKVWAAFGIHPHNAKYYHSTAGIEEKLMKCLEHSRCVALGEIGLDYGDKSPSDHTTQKEVFSHQLKLGLALKKPFVLHCRDAENDMLAILKEHVPTDWKIHFHCFTGDLSTALEFLSTYPKSYLGVCGNVTFDNVRNVAAIAREVPLTRLLVETDAPYHTPRNLPRAGRCRHSHPAHAHYVAKEIARIKDVDLVGVLQTIRDNTKTMYEI